MAELNGLASRQIELGTSVSIAVVALCVPALIWALTVKGTVDLHTDKLTGNDAAIRELRVELRDLRSLREDRDIKNAERLAAIEAQTRELLRLAERDRRAP